MRWTILLTAILSTASVTAKLRWADTEFFIAFGDSYTWDSFNISAGVTSPTPKSIPPGSVRPHTSSVQYTRLPSACRRHQMVPDGSNT